MFKSLSIKSGLDTGTSNNQFKYLDKLINQTPIGLFKKSELGEPMRIFYYLSPLDLIDHQQKDNKNGGNNCISNNFDSTYKILSTITIDQLIKHELGAYLTISLCSTSLGLAKQEAKSESEPALVSYKLPDSSLLILNENDEERAWNDYLNPYFNINFNFEK
jgi:hypothetical protein